jgi:4'-phosphopantetheinyl transferase
MEKIAERYFSPREVEAVRELPPELQIRGYFQYWTLKEAYIKGVGEGLSIPLPQAEIRTSETSGIFKVFHPKLPEAERWRLGMLPDPQAGYVAALAFQGDTLKLRCIKMS